MLAPLLLFCLTTSGQAAPPASEPSTATQDAGASAPEQAWNFHMQGTHVVQWHPHFSAQYSGPQSLSNKSEVRETLSTDVYAGARLWRGAEAHVDGMMWEGSGLSRTFGVAGFPNGEAFRIGTTPPEGTVARLFLRQTIGLGGPRETAEDDELTLAGHRDVSRITVTVGKLSVKDLFDVNPYANDPHTSFLNWSFIANGAWDYPADALGYTTGVAVELNQPVWALRYGVFQMPAHLNGVALDPHYLAAWGMVTEGERRYALAGHPGAVRALAYLNRARMGRYQDALNAPIRPADTAPFRNAYRYKYGFGVNADQELLEGVALFVRLGWSDGRTDSFTFTDVDRTVSLGLSVNGRHWKRSQDTVGIAAVVNAISHVHRDYFAAGGAGILLGDGALSYKTERLLEAYYDAQVWKTIRVAADYQLIMNPGYNRDRGPVSVLGARLHWSF